ncbi:MAG: peptidoglycan DD-metalloendopeptidase family protein [Candidatus Komeilibacteria bacterium]
MKKYVYPIIFILLLTTLALVFFRSKNQAQEPEILPPPLPTERIKTILIEPDMTFSTASELAGIDHTLMMTLLETAEEVYNLSSIRAGKELQYIFDITTNEFEQLIYPIDTEEELFVTKQEDDSWLAEKKEIQYNIKIKTVEGTIESSLYESAVAQNVDIRAIINLADVFAWSIDFGMGIRQGDVYKFIFEERYRNGAYIMPGKIIAARFVNNNKNIEGYYYHEGENEEGELLDGYYDPEGASLQKIFLKNPVHFRYISSGFTTGLRYVAAFDISTGHRAIDYAAAYGTPVQVVGDGQVIRAGWNGSYGNFISIRHNSIYTTNYAHLSQINVVYGEKVTQGEIIGKVGSTGFSTGPHLHFEVVKNGTKINPSTVDLPADKAVSKEKLADFKQSIIKWQEALYANPPG